MPDLFRNFWILRHALMGFVQHRGGCPNNQTNSFYLNQQKGSRSFLNKPLIFLHVWKQEKNLHLIYSIPCKFPLPVFLDKAQCDVFCCPGGITGAKQPYLLLFFFLITLCVFPTRKQVRIWEYRLLVDPLAHN